MRRSRRCTGRLRRTLDSSQEIIVRTASHVTDGACAYLSHTLLGFNCTTIEVYPPYDLFHPNSRPWAPAPAQSRAVDLMCSPGHGVCALMPKYQHSSLTFHTTADACPPSIFSFQLEEFGPKTCLRRSRMGMGVLEVRRYGPISFLCDP
ncbi:hypothetical protein EVAR_97657_1 [Eumeta japonica]|uniref:Uncharacterized protein n=1 Tax=Eumeta variegata TaxID=151549 RepID=A0A4C1X0R5_EUMVA|nr:hypothetical protein EVAR_97657_1 [Eumeta japonica]